MTFSICLAAILGLLIGSFLNVVVFRLGTGQSLARGRSRCFSCSKQLHWYELVPVLSYIFQKGHCRGCGSRISAQYPAVELLTGLIFGLLVWRSAPVGVYLIAAVLVAILVYDLRHMIIPDPLVYIFIILGLLYHAQYWWAGLILFGIFGGMWLVSRGKWMGFGDAKLVLGIGLWLGAASFSAMLLAFWSGALVGVALLYWRRRFITMKSEIPFAPFLIFGALVTYLWNIQIF